jgi:hypothetical protein
MPRSGIPAPTRGIVQVRAILARTPSMLEEARLLARFAG